MGAWPGVLFALLSGAAAAGATLYILGRRVERRVAEAVARAAAAEGERLEEAKQRVVLAAKEELFLAREAAEQEATRRRRELERRGQHLHEPAGGPGERAPPLPRRGP